MRKSSEKLRVDWIACEGNGTCSELVPEMIMMDEWGYPIVDDAPIPPILEREVRAAVRACPKLALKVMRS